MGRGPDSRADQLVQHAGHARPLGWPDWSGEAVCIVASGPTAKRANLNLLKDRFRFFAIKQSFDLCPWADAVYGCDGPWWRYRNGLPEFSGLKLCYSGNKLEGFPDIRRIEIPKSKVGSHGDDLVFEPFGTIGSGGNSGFQALNLAVQFGAKRILLVGFDMTDASGVHWYGRNGWHGANNPNDANFRRWIQAFYKAAPILTARGVEVVNASPSPALKAFPRKSIEDVLADWFA